MKVEYVVRAIEREFEAEFKENGGEYTAVVSNTETFTLSLGHYKTTENYGTPFYSVGYTNTKEWRGYGRPCDSVEEVLELAGKHFPARLQLTFF